MKTVKAIVNDTEVLISTDEKEKIIYRDTALKSKVERKVIYENKKMLKWKVGSVAHEKDSDSYFVNVYYENL